MFPPEDEAHGPGVKVPPPLMVLAGLMLAWALNWLAPVMLGPPAPELGLPVMLLAFLLMGWALLVLVRAGNDPRPDRPDTAFVARGPFRLGRNPIYSGFLLVAAGMALVWGTLWGWLAVGGIFLALDFLVVRREEAYLERRFGQDYLDYKAKVRRWF
ncbi:methyltransferase family protein [Roseococcus thiosulfatophilus]|uniref:methyltransferase family protein n=1 Tax=Roseococcus thiosulfatophilus TaxID=35813 RepID=UPI001A9014E8|nr:isoprenylcysteine carboxylmethyltransferase family protein [Roseococcus thiosulfatophilus]